MPLKIASSLTLSEEAVTGTFAILAMRGVGKTHTASVMAEEMLKAGQPIVVYDPTGAWWGLKSSRNGKEAGYPVVVFGGEHPDVPLEETAGDTIATTIVEKRIPAIVDCSLLRKGARIRFMTEFAETLYHKNREPLHLFLDEVQTVAPQKPMPDVARCLGAIEDIILQGRRRGLGLTAISPRPALVNTNIRSACATLIAMRIQGPHDRKAITEWIDAHGSAELAKQMLGSLAALPKGDAWVWSPADDIFKRVHFRERETFDSSATPKVGARPIQPKKMAAVDLNALGEAIRATVETAKANDPKELRKRIAELEKQLKAKPAASAKVAPDTRAINAAVAATERDWKARFTELQKANRELAGTLGRINGLSAMDKLPAAVEPPKTSLITSSTLTISPVKPAVPVPPRAAAAARHVPRAAAPVEGLSKKQQQVLDTIAWWESIGVMEPRNEQLGAIALIDTTGGYFSNVAGPLVSQGLMERGGGFVRLTEAGRAIARPLSGIDTLDDYHAMLRDRVRQSRNSNGKSIAILDAMIEANGETLTNDELGERVGVDTTGGYFSNCIGPLTTLGIIERSGGRVRPTSLLFPEGLG